MSARGSRVVATLVVLAMFPCDAIVLGVAGEKRRAGTPRAGTPQLPSKDSNAAIATKEKHGFRGAWSQKEGIDIAHYRKFESKVLNTAFAKRKEEEAESYSDISSLERENYVSTGVQSQDSDLERILQTLGDAQQGEALEGEREGQNELELESRKRRKPNSAANREVPHLNTMEMLQRSLSFGPKGSVDGASHGARDVPSALDVTFGRRLEPEFRDSEPEAMPFDIGDNIDASHTKPEAMPFDLADNIDASHTKPEAMPFDIADNIDASHTKPEAMPFDIADNTDRSQ